jgi:hypothetical protein
VATRGGKVLVGFVIVGALLCAAAGVADRAAANEAENRIADSVKQEAAANGVQFSGEPDVRIGGYPFLTQAVRGKYQSVRITLKDLRAEGVSLPELVVDAEDIDAPLDTVLNGTGPIVAKTVSGTGVIDLNTILALVNEPGLTLTTQGDRLIFRIPLQISGIAVPLVGSGKVAITDSKLQVSLEKVETESGQKLPPQANQLLQQEKAKWSVTIPLPILPYKLRLKSARITASGLIIDAEAKDITLAR